MHWSMKLAWILVATIGTIGTVVMGAYTYAGGFQTLTVDTLETTSQPMAGLYYRGGYETMVPTFEKANLLLDSLGTAKAPGLAWFFDDPKTVAKQECRGFYGRALTQTLDSAALFSLRASGLHLDTLPGGKALVVVYRASNTLAYRVGPLLAYPLLDKAIREAHYDAPLAVYENYDEEKGVTYYTAVLGNENSEK